MKKTHKKNIKIIFIITCICIVLYWAKGFFFWSSIETCKTISPDMTEPILIEQNLESYNDKATIEFWINLSSGNLKVELYDNNDNNIGEENITSNNSYKKSIKIRDFGDKVKIKMIPENASADVTVAFISK